MSIAAQDLRLASAPQTPDALPLAFPCDGAQLVGMLHGAAAAAMIGVVIVVGGPQYRCGSHRQFVLLARALAREGLCVLRFDCRGMGDSDGEFAGFERLDSDIRAAVDALRRAAPSVEKIFLWGLCDAAWAVAVYAPQDPRITGVALANPWVRTQAGEARTYLKHYYLSRLATADFWRRVVTWKFRPIASASSFILNSLRALAWRRAADTTDKDAPLAERMAAALQRYRGAILLVLSGRDFVAREFEDAIHDSERWRSILDQGHRVTIHRLAEADHTFSCRAWRDQAADWTGRWIERCAGATAKGAD